MYFSFFLFFDQFRAFCAPWMAENGLLGYFACLHYFRLGTPYKKWTKKRGGFFVATLLAATLCACASGWTRTSKLGTQDGTSFQHMQFENVSSVGTSFSCKKINKNTFLFFQWHISLGTFLLEVICYFFFFSISLTLKGYLAGALETFQFMH